MCKRRPSECGDKVGYTGETPVPPDAWDPERPKLKTGYWPLFSKRVLDRAGVIGYKSPLPGRRKG